MDVFNHRLSQTNKKKTSQKNENMSKDNIQIDVQRLKPKRKK